MASALSSSAVQASFEALEKQRELINTCTLLWKELSEHFTSLEKGLDNKSESLKTKRRFLEVRTKRALDTLRRREDSIDSSVNGAISAVEKRRRASIEVVESDQGSDAADLAEKLKFLCAKMDSSGFLDLVLSKRKEADLLRVEVPLALEKCVDPARFVVDAMCVIFPVDKREVKTPNDVAWACVLVLESLEPVVADPELGSARPLVPRSMRDKARAMANAWKEGLEARGGVEGSKPADAHAFLQLVVTFGIVSREEKGLYRKIVVSFSRRRQMPKIALAVGLEDEMDDIIEELIAKGQQVDAVNFAYEAGLQDKYPPVPLLKSYLDESMKSSTFVADNHGQTGSNTCRREQSAVRAAIKCIEDHKLEAEFPMDDLQKRLESLEKAKPDKKKSSASSTTSSGGCTSTCTNATNSTATSAPPNKRTRANHGGPMPPAKAGRLTNNAYVGPNFVRSPSHVPYQVSAPAPHYHAVYGSRSPQAIREPYTYQTDEVAASGIAMSYPSHPMGYPAYGGYNNPMPGYGFHQAYYR
ncbi:hypothetical protein LUZ61_009340 [Rhynchospora tenuis]|uniref:FRIGIDA-like protein n=1 Tax=Rhynchospora tenuis TaxID=198213 RepID=A0AAD5ZX70_9POAL|nr:hypothetical protein LUZ61_009340 [Rhynchospora tenuis]